MKRCQKEKVSVLSIDKSRSHFFPQCSAPIWDAIASTNSISTLDPDQLAAAVALERGSDRDEYSRTGKPDLQPGEEQRPPATVELRNLRNLQNL
jgi:hypothetical protein